jgi:hypothetical protein
MSIESVCLSWEAVEREKCMVATWGHLAPTKNKTYRGHIVWALGCIGSDDLNPTIMELEMGELPSSPWLFEPMRDFLRSHSREGGALFRLDGTFRNYKWKGAVTRLNPPGLGEVTFKPRRAKLARRDFERIAAEIRVLPVAARAPQFRRVLRSLQASNPRFDQKRFIVACGL